KRCRNVARRRGAWDGCLVTTRRPVAFRRCRSVVLWTSTGPPRRPIRGRQKGPGWLQVRLTSFSDATNCDTLRHHGPAENRVRSGEPSPLRSAPQGTQVTRGSDRSWSSTRPVDWAVNPRRELTTAGPIPVAHWFPAR